MLGRKKRRQATISTLVGADTRVHGDVEFTGGFHVDGYVKGNVKSVNDEDSVLSISERGCVEGAVMVPHVLLNGTVKGDVRATERVELGTKARVIGNVQYKLIEMAIGAEVNGKLIHESENAVAELQVAPQETALREAAPREAKPRDAGREEAKPQQAPRLQEGKPQEGKPPQEAPRLHEPEPQEGKPQEATGLQEAKPHEAGLQEAKPQVGPVRAINLVGE